ncbi:MAG: DUF1559 domain-containing protein [Pirellulales bacterium]
MNRRGITLLELVVVLAILSLLVALLVPAVQVARESAHCIQCCANLKNLVLAHQLYHDAHNRFPTEWARSMKARDGAASTNSGATPTEFQCPSNVNEVDSAGAGLTPYGFNVFLVGEPISKITDGTSSTVLHGEFIARQGTAWFSSPGLSSVNCASAHLHGAHYGMADGSVKFLNCELAEDVRVYLILPDDGEVVGLPY